MADRLNILFEKYMSNDCSKQELQEFWTIIARLPDNDFLTLELETAWKDSLNGSPSKNKEELFAKVLTRAKGEETGIVPYRRLNWTRVAAAAVIILVLGAQAYFLFSTNNPKKDIAVKKQSRHLKDDIAPGVNNATLTLNNGTQIILDSASNGTVTQQGNTKIIILNSGQLSYKGSPEASPGGASLEEAYNSLSTAKGN